MEETKEWTKEEVDRMYDLLTIEGYISAENLYRNLDEEEAKYEINDLCYVEVLLAEHHFMKEHLRCLVNRIKKLEETQAPKILLESEKEHLAERVTRELDKVEEIENRAFERLYANVKDDGEEEEKAA